jgi:hypothetical protein
VRGARAQRDQTPGGGSPRGAAAPPAREATRQDSAPPGRRTTQGAADPALPPLRRQTRRADGLGLHYWILSGASMGTLGRMTGSYRLPAGVSCSGGCVLQWVRTHPRAARRRTGPAAHAFACPLRAAVGGPP